MLIDDRDKNKALILCAEASCFCQNIKNLSQLPLCREHDLGDSELPGYGNYGAPLLRSFPSQSMLLIECRVHRKGGTMILAMVFPHHPLFGS